jgi:hypothetical protein
MFGITGRGSVAVFASIALFAGSAAADDVHVTVNGVQRVPPVEVAGPKDPPRERADQPCEKDCFVLSHLDLHGAVDGTMTFELQGAVRAKEETKIPLFGPPGQVHVSDVTIDGARANLMFDSDQYFLFTSARSFTVRGKISLGTDWILTIPGPLVALDARLTKGKLIEGDKQSGILASVLHFDPMIEGEEGGDAAKPKVPTVFRVSRALRVGHETAFVYRITASQGADLGVLRFPLRHGEKVQDAQGSTGWSVEGSDLLLPTSGKEADITVSGTLTNVKSFTPDERAAYEWLLVEADPEHRVATSGEGKLVETSQSPLPPTMPGARVYLLQRGQKIDVESRSLVRGDVLAAVARSHNRFVAISGAGELISDEGIHYENNGLDHLSLTPAGKAVYLSNDGAAQRILHDDEHSKDVLVPVATGSHRLRVQTLSNVRIWPLVGALTIPPSTYPLSTSTVDTTVGLPPEVHPLAVLGGDNARWGFGRGDLAGVALGIALACFGFRTRKTRALGAAATAGLWFVSREGFVIAASLLAVVGLVFLASRFLRGTKLLVASGFIVSAGMLVARGVLSDGGASEPARDMLVERPTLPSPESSGSFANPRGGTPGDITPVSLSFPTSERYVISSRQVVSQERPFVPRIVYVTSTLIGFLHLVWLGLVGLLVFAHRDKLALLKAKIVERLARRPEVVPEAPASAIAAVATPLHSPLHLEGIEAPPF